MYYTMIRNDMLRNKLITLTTILFITVAAMLVALSAILIVNLSGAINTLMTKAQTPHFMQMHSGELDMERLTTFVKASDKIEQFQVLSFLNIEASDIIINGQSLAGSVQDHGLSTQSNKFDFLLDLDGNVITAAEGEIYVPVNYMKDRTAKLGDTIVIAGKRLTVAGFLRDSQMNSLLASSKRFLVHEKDYINLQHAGNIEFLIQFRLHQLSMLSAFEQEYIAAEIEANGPTVTYPLFKMLNAITDGIMIAVILLASVLVVLITFMCIRFTLLATMESDYREIGVLKAIGMRISHIRSIYLAKYSVMTFVGCIAGLLLAMIYRGLLLQNIKLFMGESEHASIAIYAGLLGVFVVFTAIMLFANTVMRRCKNISPAEAIRFGISQDKSSVRSSFLSLSRSKWLGTNLFLGMKDVLVRKRLYGTMLAVIIISTFVMIVPQNLYHTISSNSFITYMGIGNSDIRFDIQQTSHILDKAAAISNILEHDPAIAKHTVLSTSSFYIMTSDGSKERITVELGDHFVFPVTYFEGRAPIAEDEMALSSLNAAELGVNAGDSIMMLIEDNVKAVTITGIYSDVTNGGKTAKANFKVNQEKMLWSIIYAKLKDPTLLDEKVQQYAKAFSYAKVTDIEQFVRQTFGPTIQSIGKASIIAIVVMLLINLLVTLLFLKLLVEKDKYSIAILKSLGFTSRDIVLQYFIRSSCVLIVGIGCGVIAAQTIGPVISSAMMSSLGVTKFTFVVNPFTAYILCPLFIIVTVWAATWASTWRAGNITISEYIKE